MKTTTISKAIILVFFISLSISITPTQAQENPLPLIYQENFEDRQAQGWEINPGWEIIQEDNNQVLAGKGHVWAYSNISYDDYKLTFRIKVIRGMIHLVYHFNDKGRYFIGFMENGTYLQKQYWPDTFLTDLASSNNAHQLNQWHTVEISNQGAELQFTVDGKKEWTYTDPEPLLEGSFAFESLDDSVAYVDDVSVELAPTSLFILATGTKPASSYNWVRTGGPLGGLGYDVRMQTDNPDEMYVTDANAGIFLSHDGGKNWSLSNEGISTRSGQTGDIIPIFCLTIDPTNPDTIWAGTQDMRGIFKSTDGGITWEKLDNGIVEDQGITFRGFAVEPNNSETVFAAAELSSYVWNNGQEKKGREFDMTAGVVYKTTDGGKNWKAVWRGDNLARYIWINPQNTSIIYVSTGIFDREAKNSNPKTGLPGGVGVIKSTDGGATWVQAINGLNNLYVGSLFMNPTNPDSLLAATGNNQYQENSGIYLTKDGGNNWTQVLSGDMFESVEISMSNPEIAYAAGANFVYRSKDGGYSWEQVAGESGRGWGPFGIHAGFPIDLQVDPRNSNRIFANAYGGGNFLSEDGGITWIDASRGYTGAQVRAIAVDPKQPGRVFAAARSGIFISKDGGSTWEGLNFLDNANSEWNAIAIDPQNAEHILAGTNQNTVLADTLSGGINWIERMSSENQRVGWKSIVFAPSDSNTIYAGLAGYYSAGSFDTSQPGKGLYISRDGGITWNQVNDTLTQDAYVNCLAVHPKDPNLVFVATENHGLLKTIDGGNHWQSIQDTLPTDSASVIAINPANPDYMIAGFNRKSLYISTDGGATWQQSTHGLVPESTFSSIVFNPSDPTNTIYLADSSSGVYRSANSGKTWELINTGLNMRSINALAISTDGMHLYAASEGGGVFRLDINGKSPDPYTEQKSTNDNESTSTPAIEDTVGSNTATNTPVTAPLNKLPCGIGAFLPLIVLALFQVMRQRIQ
jgi:photosystem II stability/assembly factor-like uncharacterized protein